MRAYIKTLARVDRVRMELTGRLGPARMRCHASMVTRLGGRVSERAMLRRQVVQLMRRDKQMEVGRKVRRERKVFSTFIGFIVASC